jgi:hypothetical protein
MNKCKNKSLCISKLFLDNFKGQNKENCVNTQGPPEPGRRGVIPPLPLPEVSRNRSKPFLDYYSHHLELID